MNQQRLKSSRADRKGSEDFHGFEKLYIWISLYWNLSQETKLYVWFPVSLSTCQHQRWWDAIFCIFVSMSTSRFIDYIIYFSLSSFIFIFRARSLVASNLRLETKSSRFGSGCYLCAEVSPCGNHPANA